ncbi:unnamed protein product [Lactuca saligna]|uniref:Uncharacterized protein n=1 Tax=Lactuca saligna TaxID=75948 RepID=A0AA35YS99_LACSI|nr:unnamed protein product [Lactuca saligna]
MAWAVINVENKQNWKWFLELLIVDLDLNLGNGFTLMSDQHKGQQWGNHICPEIRDKVNLLKKIRRHYQLNRYGCAHSVASISFLNKDVEAYVDNMFSTTTFRKAYNYRISPMNSSDMWLETNYTPQLPPISRRMQVRPTTKRKKSTTENIGTYKVSISAPQQHKEVEMTPIEMDTTQNDMQATPTDVESSSARDFSHFMQFTPPRSYEDDQDEEAVVGEEVKKGVVGKEVVMGEEAEDGGNAQEFNPNVQVVDIVQIKEFVHVIQVQQVRVRPISDILKRIRRRKSEIILKLKLGKTIGGVDDPRNSKGKALVIDYC